MYIVSLQRRQNKYPNKGANQFGARKQQYTEDNDINDHFTLFPSHSQQ